MQGVGFRYFTPTAARRCGVVGWVRNEPDQSVLGEAEGEREAMERFVAKLRAGPRFSRVDELSIETLPDEKRPNHAPTESSFEIR